MLQLFQTKKGSFFHRQLVYSSCIAFPYIMHCIHLSHFFGASSENICHIYSLMTARLRLFHTETLFSPLKYTVYKCYSCFRQRRGHFFIVTPVYSGCIAFPYIMHCIHLSRFFGVSSENICPIHYIVHSSSQSVSYLILFSSLKYIVYRCYSCFRQRRSHFVFHRHTCIQWLHGFSLYNALYTLVTLFWCYFRKLLSHRLHCAQLVSVCFTLKVCFCF